MSTVETLSPLAQRAWRSSLLADLPSRVGQLLADEAHERHIASGEIIFRASPQSGSPPVYLVIDGLARTYVRAENGREVTVRYVAEGEIVGLPGLIAGHSNASVAVMVMIDTTVLSLPADRLVRLAETDVAVAWPLARYLAEIHHTSEEVWSNHVFKGMPARVAYHLLELCTRDTGGLVVHATQDDLAGAVGTVREVVARTLKGLADASLVERGAGAIRLIDPAGLHRIASEPTAPAH